MDNTVNWQAVRDWTARKVMGWTLVPDDFNDSHMYFEPNNGPYVMLLEHWHPDTDWAQCGMVIEKMHERGYFIRQYYADKADDPRQMCWCTMSSPVVGGLCGVARTLTPCQAATLAAAYATGYEDTDD